MKVALLKVIKSYPLIIAHSLLLFIATSIFPSTSEQVGSLYYYKYGLYPYLSIEREVLGPLNQSIFMQYSGAFYVNILQLLGSYATCLGAIILVHVLFQGLTRK